MSGEEVESCVVTTLWVVRLLNGENKPLYCNVPDSPMGESLAYETRWL